MSLRKTSLFPCNHKVKREEEEITGEVVQIYDTATLKWKSTHIRVRL